MEVVFILIIILVVLILSVGAYLCFIFAYLYVMYGIFTTKEDVGKVLLEFIKGLFINDVQLLKEKGNQMLCNNLILKQRVFVIKGKECHTIQVFLLTSFMNGPE